MTTSDRRKQGESKIKGEEYAIRGVQIDQVRSRGPKAPQKRCFLKWDLKGGREVVPCTCWGRQSRAQRAAKAKGHKII